MPDPAGRERGRRTRPRRRGFSAALVLTAVALLASPAAAQVECDSAVGAAAAHSEAEIAARLRFLRQSLRDTALLEQRFALGWSLTYAGLAAGTWALLPFSANPDGQRIASIWNSSTSIAAGLLVLIGPLQVIRDKNRLEALLAPARPQSDCAVLSHAEQLLKHAARSETGARSARAHIISALSAVGVGLVLGYGLKQADSAATNTTIGILLGELMIASRPTVAVQRLQSYRSGDLSIPPPPVGGFSVGLAPLLISSGYGAAVSGAF